MKYKKFFLITLLLLVLILVVNYVKFPLYPQPEYTVSSYQDLIESLSSDTNILVPDEIVLPDNSFGYTVFVKSRFSHIIAGYAIYTTDSKKDIVDSLTIECRNRYIDNDNDKIPRSDLILNNVNIEINSYSKFSELSFIFEDYHYSIRYKQTTYFTTKDAISLTTNMITN